MGRRLPSRRAAGVAIAVILAIGLNAPAWAQPDTAELPAPVDSSLVVTPAAMDSLGPQPPPSAPVAPQVLEPPCTDPALLFRASWIPAPAHGATTGSAFVQRTTGWDGRKRQTAALEELRRGNLPDFMRQLKPVRLLAVAQAGRKIEAVVWVTPDYVSIGNDSNFVRMPLSLPVAVSLARDLGFVLPTQKIVDAVYEQADFRFTPQPLPPSVMMRSSQYFAKHNGMIEEQRRGRPLGELVAGHKKDIVLTNRVFGTERIAIYGWHKRDGTPIQGLSLVHGARYADYSHGVRLVYNTVCIDGELRSIFEVLEDPEIAGVLSYEGWARRARSFMSRRAWK